LISGISSPSLPGVSPGRVANDGAPGINATSAADVKEYGVAGLLDELDADLHSSSFQERMPAAALDLGRRGGGRGAIGLYGSGGQGEALLRLAG
jgi:hypothetical protein